jgi:hypothetical protein
MKQLNLKTLNSIFNLLTEEDLASDFGKFKLKHKLNLIKQISLADETTVSTIDYILENMLTEIKPSSINTEISLISYYSLSEVEAINKTLNLAANNFSLSEKLLDDIYNKNKSVEQIRELYYQLKAKHFKPVNYYLDERYQGLTNVADRLQYEQEKKNELR